VTRYNTLGHHEVLQYKILWESKLQQIL